jgi:patatin-like phospholipase/acyl hydrolase
MIMSKKVLTIDGGGIRGVFSAAVIEQMEKVIGKKAGEYFDCLYGTSTGAILAAALANGMSA